MLSVFIEGGLSWSGACHNEDPNADKVSATKPGKGIKKRGFWFWGSRCSIPDPQSPNPKPPFSVLCSGLSILGSCSQFVEI